MRRVALWSFSIAPFRFLASITVLLLFSSLCFARAMRPFNPKDLRILSLNLHAYHPMNEPDRLVQNRLGEIKEVNSDIFFFTPEELDRGSRNRLNLLTKAVQDLEPDIILLQEVSAGGPGQTTCSDFHAPFKKDALTENTALRLHRRLIMAGAPYNPFLFCRGNVGWITDSKTFKNNQILKQNPNGTTEVVIPFGANPYPKGIVVEGLAMLTRAPLQIIDRQEWALPYNETPDRYYVQLAAFTIEANRRSNSNAQAPVMVIANIHGGHKVPHFEQTIALRRKIDEYIASASWKTRFHGLLIAGDFNAALYRPREKRGYGYIDSAAWEVAVDGQFDLRVQNSKFDPELLAKHLEELNSNKDYKPWATITNPAEAKRRIQSAIQSFIDWQKDPAGSGLPKVLQSAFWEAQKRKLCQPMTTWNIACEREKNIDQIFYSQNFKLTRSFIAFSDAGWATTRSLSDHPGIQAHFDITTSSKKTQH